MEWIVVGIAAFGLLGLIIYIARKERAKNRAPSEHRAHMHSSGNRPIDGGFSGGAQGGHAPDGGGGGDGG